MWRARSKQLSILKQTRERINKSELIVNKENHFNKCFCKLLEGERQKNSAMATKNLCFRIHKLRIYIYIYVYTCRSGIPAFGLFGTAIKPDYMLVHTKRFIIEHVWACVQLELPPFNISAHVPSVGWVGSVAARKNNGNLELQSNRYAHNLLTN